MSNESIELEYYPYLIEDGKIRPLGEEDGFQYWKYNMTSKKKTLESLQRNSDDLKIWIDGIVILPRVSY